MTELRSLYQCSHAHVSKRIFCERGWYLDRVPTINIERLARGMALELTVCQRCKDFDCMGGPVDKEDRGWFRR